MNLGCQRLQATKANGFSLKSIRNAFWIVKNRRIIMHAVKVNLMLKFQVIDIEDFASLLSRVQISSSSVCFSDEVFWGCFRVMSASSKSLLNVIFGLNEPKSLKVENKSLMRNVLRGNTVR
jgi:hypothetical protein